MKLLINSTRHSPFMILALMCALPLAVWLALNFTINTVVKHHAEYRGIYWSQLLQTRFPNLENHFQLRSAANEHFLKLDEGMSAAEIGSVTLFRLDGSVSKEFGTPKKTEEAGHFELNREKAATVLASGLHSIHSNINQNNTSNSPNYIDVYVPMVNFKGEPIGIFGIQVDQTVASGIIYSTFSWLIILLPLLIGAAYLFPTLAFSKRHGEALYAERTVELLSKYDALTGTQNRASFSKAAEKLFSHKMDKTQRIGVIFIDIDDFKKINAENGHTAGDVFLIHVASSIKKQIRESDLVSRFGGDQFIVCLPSVSATQLNRIAERILRGVEKSVFHQGNLINQKINVGTYLAEGGQSFEQAISAADAALNNAKDCNKNHVVEYTAELDRELQIRRNLENLLNKAQTGDGLELFYQPIVDPKTHLVLGFEALMRLRDEHGKMISPMEFIPVATELGLINSMGRWAIDEALATAKCWPAPIFVAVNLSPVQFEEGDLPDTVKSALKKHDFISDRLELEVTESLLMGDDGEIYNQIRAIKELGVCVSMDDFGTGYSSLSYLWKYEFSKLKIDRSFLLGYDDEPETLKDIIESIVILGHRIGMSVTAEGVETHIHASMLADVGCDSLQGFFFARPMPAWEATQAINLQHLQVTSRKMSGATVSTELENDRKSA